MSDNFELRCEGRENEILYAIRGNTRALPGIIRVKIKNAIHQVYIPFKVEKVLIDKDGKLFIDGVPKQMPPEEYRVDE